MVQVVLELVDGDLELLGQARHQVQPAGDDGARDEQGHHADLAFGVGQHLLRQGQLGVGRGPPLLHLQDLRLGAVGPRSDLGGEVRVGADGREVEVVAVEIAAQQRGRGVAHEHHAAVAAAAAADVPPDPQVAPGAERVAGGQELAARQVAGADLAQGQAVVGQRHQAGEVQAAAHRQVQPALAQHGHGAVDRVRMLVQRAGLIRRQDVDERHLDLLGVQGQQLHQGAGVGESLAQAHGRPLDPGHQVRLDGLPAEPLGHLPGRLGAPGLGPGHDAQDGVPDVDAARVRLARGLEGRHRQHQVDLALREPVGLVAGGQRALGDQPAVLHREPELAGAAQVAAQHRPEPGGGDAGAVAGPVLAVLHHQDVERDLAGRGGPAGGEQDRPVGQLLLGRLPEGVSHAAVAGHDEVAFLAAAGGKVQPEAFGDAADQLAGGHAAGVNDGEGGVREQHLGHRPGIGVAHPIPLAGKGIKPGQVHRYLLSVLAHCPCARRSRSGILGCTAAWRRSRIPALPCG